MSTKGSRRKGQSPEERDAELSAITARSFARGVLGAQYGGDCPYCGFPVITARTVCLACDPESVRAPIGGGWMVNGIRVFRSGMPIQAMLR